MAIMGPFVYDACLTSSGTTSTAALSNPYDRTISFTYNFFAFQYMTNVITDQHFVTRDRMGRLLSFMARQIKDGKGTYVWGIAANEETSIVVDEVGSALVVRNDGVTGYDVPLPPASANPVAYYIYLDHMPEVCASKKPLTCTGYKVWKRAYDQTFNMATKPTTNPDYTISVSAGVMTSSTGSVY